MLISNESLALLPIYLIIRYKELYIRNYNTTTEVQATGIYQCNSGIIIRVHKKFVTVYICEKIYRIYLYITADI